MTHTKPAGDFTPPDRRLVVHEGPHRNHVVRYAGYGWAAPRERLGQLDGECELLQDLVTHTQNPLVILRPRGRARTAHAKARLGFRAWSQLAGGRGAGTQSMEFTCSAGLLFVSPKHGASVAPFFELLVQLLEFQVVKL